ncbi:MAG: META domain-containing protein [Candidatus Promineifilaceae bacterium]|nr:META domain-containing protein [Candidatus Promineifilaceae bacterium]
MHRKLLLPMILLLALILAACSDQEGSDSGQAPDEGAYPAPGSAEDSTGSEGEAAESAYPPAPSEQADTAGDNVVLGTALVDAVAVSQQGDQWVVNVQGNLNDGCTQIAGTNQNVVGSAITIEVITARPEDQMCTQALVPYTQDVVIDTSQLAPGEYTVLANDVMAAEKVVVGEAGQPVDAPDAGQGQFVNIVWQWSELVETNPAGQSVVPDPENYTITFSSDGAASVKADCNMLQLTYTVNGDMLTINMLGPSTMAFCGEDSLDTQYLALLSGVNSWAMSDGRLQLMTNGGATMTFDNGGPAAGSVGIDPGQISLDTMGLPYSWQAVTVPEQPYDESMPPGPQGLPEHIQILFGVTDPADRQPTDPVIFIIPVKSYEAMYAANENESVAQAMEDIADLTYALPDPAPVRGYPVLPTAPYSPAAGSNDLAVQVGRAMADEMSASKNGFRYVGRWAQSANPVSNQGLTYVYQGFTNDGAYLVSFFYPVNSNLLPATASDVSQEDLDQYNSDFEAYRDAKAAELNATGTADWDPDLATLDAVIGSLQIEGMAASGLQERQWQWAGTQAEGSDEVVPVERSTDYLIYFEDDGNFQFQADCNTGGGSYTFDGGFNGSLNMQVGPMTRAACPADSRSDEYVNNLFHVRDFRLHPGGQTLELDLPAGGGVMVFHVQGSSDIELPEPEPGQPQGTIIAPAGANVRLGPGTSYPIVGFAPFNSSGEILGVSADGQWWATDAPKSPSQIGWVLGELVAAENVENVRVLPAPALPTPTPAPTPVPPPSPTVQFSANSTSINAGECTVLNWSTENIQAVWIYPKGENYQDYGVPGVGETTVCPTSSTTYEMRVQHTDGSLEFRSVTVQVNPSNNLANTSWTLSALYVNQIPAPGVIQTAYFGVTNDISVNGGCNSYGGTYTVSGSSITIGPLAGTLISCGESVDSQEQAYLSALEAARTFAINGSQLLLYDGGGNEVARFNFAR